MCKTAKHAKIGIFSNKTEYYIQHIARLSIYTIYFNYFLYFRAKVEKTGLDHVLQITHLYELIYFNGRIKKTLIFIYCNFNYDIMKLMILL